MSVIWRMSWWSNVNETLFANTIHSNFPRRASLLTGRQPPRTGVYNGVLHPDSMGGLPPKEITIAEMLKQANYSTSFVGKWHLGVGKDNRYMPTNQGFDDYYGIPYSHDMCPCTKCFYPDKKCLYDCTTSLAPCALMKGKSIFRLFGMLQINLPTQIRSDHEGSQTWFSFSIKQIFKKWYLFTSSHEPRAMTSPVFSKNKMAMSQI